MDAIPAKEAELWSIFLQTMSAETKSSLFISMGHSCDCNANTSLIHAGLEKLRDLISSSGIGRRRREYSTFSLDQ